MRHNYTQYFWSHINLAIDIINQGTTYSDTKDVITHDWTDKDLFNSEIWHTSHSHAETSNQQLHTNQIDPQMKITYLF